MGKVISLLQRKPVRSADSRSRNANERTSRSRPRPVLKIPAGLTIPTDEELRRPGGLEAVLENLQAGMERANALERYSQQAKRKQVAGCYRTAQYLFANPAARRRF